MTYMNNDSKTQVKEENVGDSIGLALKWGKKHSIEVVVEQEKKTIVLCLCVTRHVKCKPRKCAHRTGIFQKKLHQGFWNWSTFIHSLEPITLHNIDKKNKLIAFKGFTQGGRCGSYLRDLTHNNFSGWWQHIKSLAPYWKSPLELVAQIHNPLTHNNMWNITMMNI